MTNLYHHHALKITTTKLKTGWYLIEREDGRSFRVRRYRPVTGVFRMRWLIEDQGNFALDSAPTLATAKGDIRYGWTPLTRHHPKTEA